MPRLKSVCIDIDGTLTDPYFFIPILNRLTQKNISIDQYTSIDWRDVYGPEDAEMYKNFDIEHGDVYKTAGIQDGAKDVIDFLLKKGIDVHYVTARSKSIHEITADWVDSKGLDREKLISLGGKEGKVDTAKRLYCDVFIEDDPNNAEKLSKAGINVILLDCNYNKGLEGDRIRRMYSWKEIGDYFKKEV